MAIRVRFAPSPTGPFSLGNARTALFNWLFARHEGGAFLVRVEDTDKERSRKEYEEDIVSGLKWLGLMSDEPLVRQSERLYIYEKYLEGLLDSKNAYYCFCSAEALEAEYQAQLSQGLVPKYSGRCRGLSEEEVKKRLAESKGVIRFRMPEKVIAFTDLVRGKVEFNTGLFGDIIIAKGLKEPLYNFAVVVDDHDMNITHVIRGEDHLSNTPKQIAMQEVLKFTTPYYGHLPLILGADRKKLSKRLMARSLNEYKDEGYLPQAVFTMLALLGWHPTHDKELLTSEEIVREFDIKRVQKGGAIFVEEKLDWLNGQYIRLSPFKELLPGLKQFLPATWLSRSSFLEEVWDIEKERVKKLGDFPKSAGFFFEPPDYPEEILLWKGVSREATMNYLQMAHDALDAFSAKDFTKDILEREIGALAEKNGRGEVFWPLRVAVSGKSASPGPIEIAVVLGKKETLVRIERAIKKLESSLQQEGKLV